MGIAHSIAVSREPLPLPFSRPNSKRAILMGRWQSFFPDAMADEGVRMYGYSLSMWVQKEFLALGGYARRSENFVLLLKPHG